MSVEIDRGSGFCGGVIRAINGAEKALAEGGTILSLGDIVHNEAELSRLRGLGLETLTLSDLNAGGESLPSSATLLIRAHGEPPSTYALAKSLGFKVLDYTCPVVLRIQRSIREAYARLHSSQPYGQIVIFGKIGHAEVLGLVGQVGGDAIVVENLQQLQDLVNEGRLNTARRIEIFSQTTKSPVEYKEVCDWLSSRMVYPRLLAVNDTICRQVADRHRDLVSFARAHDVIVFVSGRESSNGKVLSGLCKSVNIRTYRVVGPEEVQKAWFRSDDRVGVCGATSTPKWLLEQVAQKIKG
ncbi:MAG: 4-hydroxy-3-methylbut-2-enyl diphosphate reductase [Bacteroidales bacterium]|nr:4-hydroxy-3-methylbut-2-enyl diphosphate reductase [Bacteroidales bacterium]